jgi:gliding motility-associated-like protein
MCLPISYDLAQAFVFSIDGQPYTAGLTACTNGTQILSPAGIHQLTIFNATFGCTDTLILKVDCPEVLVETTTVQIGNFVNFCPADFDLGTIDSISQTCDNTGNNVNFSYDEMTMCYTIEGLTVGSDTICLQVCTTAGVCTDVLLIAIAEPGNCPDILSDETVFAGGNCGSLAAVCINIPLQSILDYSIADNGVPYSNGFQGCDYDTMQAYTYFTVPGLGNAGPYTIDYWSVNGSSFSGTVQDIVGLVNFMNFNDPTGNWQLQPGTLTIFGGDPGKNYGAMMVTQTSTGAFAVLELNTNLVPNGTSLALIEGLHELTFINNLTGCTELLNVQVICTEAKYISDSMLVTTIDTLFLETSELLGSNYTIQNLCPDVSGSVVTFEFIQGTNGIQCHALEVGVEQACFLLCDEFGICDTTYATVTVYELVSQLIPELQHDTIVTYENTTAIINVLDNDQVNGTLSSITITNMPEHGTAIVTVDNTILYVPETDWCSDTELDVFTYVVCNQAGCDEATVFVQVWCSDVYVFNGFSPNGDGINDVLIIEGLAMYPNNRLQIFNRWGNRVFDSVSPYKNNWDGRWHNGQLVPDGTYFYLLKLNGDETRSGYIQIQR